MHWWSFVIASASPITSVSLSWVAKIGKDEIWHRALRELLEKSARCGDARAAEVFHGIERKGGLASPCRLLRGGPFSFYKSPLYEML